MAKIVFTRRVGITWNCSFLFWGNIMLQFKTVCFALQGRLQTVPFHSRTIPSTINNSRQCSFNVVLRCSGKFNELQFVSKVNNAQQFPFVRLRAVSQSALCYARNDSCWHRESLLARDILPLHHSKFTPIYIRSKI